MNLNYCARIAIPFLLAAAVATILALRGEQKPGENLSLPESLPSAERFRVLVNEYQKARVDFAASSQAANTEEERRDLEFSQLQKYAARFLRLAENCPKDPAAFDALVWVVTRTRSGPAFEKALSIVQDRYFHSDKLARLCDALGHSESEAAKKLLAEILRKNPHREVQGHACLALGRLAKRGDPAAAERYINLVVEKYADLKHWFSSTALGDLARAELFETKNLVVGEVAPEIEGADLDDQGFKLSDYRGRVVLIDFWGDW